MSTEPLDPIRRYQDAKRRLEAAYATLRGLGDRLHHDADVAGTDRVRLIGCRNAADPASGDGASARLTITEEDWPTWDQFGDALAAACRAKQEYRHAEHALSPDDRQVVGLREVPVSSIAGSPAGGACADG